MKGNERNNKERQFKVNKDRKERKKGREREKEEMRRGKRQAIRIILQLEPYMVLQRS